MTTKKKSGNKGYLAEEALRSYFLESGYFVARGVPVVHGSFEITDVDLWLYLRASALGRLRANVDAKYKSSPKAAERILWARGLQAALGLDEAIVATTSKNPMMRSFGESHGVRVLDGVFVGNIVGRFSRDNSRLSEEEFMSLLSEQGLDKLQGDWSAAVRESRARLLTALNFSGCNSWLSDATRFFDSFAAGQRRESALRCAYLSLAHFLVGIDYCLCQLAFLPQDVRRTHLRLGFMYGDGGKERMDSLLSLLQDARPDVYRQLRVELDDESDIRADMLAEFFARNENGGRAFQHARQFEAAAYQRRLTLPGDLDFELKSLVGVVSDSHSLSRSSILESSEE